VLENGGRLNVTVLLANGANVLPVSLSLALAALVYIAAALSGLGAGVVVNVLADRIEGDEEPPWRAGSCQTCRAALPTSRLMPVLALHATRRRCVACGKVASLRVPLLGIALAVIFPLLAARVLDPATPTRISPWLILLLDLIVCCFLAFVFAVDLEHRLIFDISIYPPIILLLAAALIFDRKALAAMLFGVIICGGLFLVLYGLGFLLYRQEALGFGDVKLAVLIGVLVGWPAIGTAIGLAALFGAAISVLLLGVGTVSRRTFIPFGIFMALGAVLSLLLAPPYW
jgi:leader peptidase (prepilin peptidase) / N-methyltransferase